MWICWLPVVLSHLLVDIAVALGVQADEGVALREVKVLQDGVRADLLRMVDTG